MVHEVQWPPKSPLKALLSSPTGRRKYTEHQNNIHATTSPNKISTGTPSLLDKLRAARADQDYLIFDQQSPGDDEEDEETLRLQLAAIQAKLKLKRLQQNKEKQDRTQLANSLPENVQPRLEVALSPSKRPTTTEPRSPSRVRLGIDKGLNAADVSLRRAKSVAASPKKQKTYADAEAKQKSGLPRQPFSHLANTDSTPAISFSERMTASRDSERQKENKQTDHRKRRVSHFEVDQGKMQSMPDSVSQGHTFHPQSTSLDANLRRAYQDLDKQINDETISGRALRPSRSMPNIRAASPHKLHQKCSGEAEQTGEAALYEGFSRVQLSTRYLPHTYLKRTLPSEDFKTYRIPDLLKDVIAPSFELPDEVVNFVVFGIIASKSSPLDHRAGSAEKNSSSTKDWESKWKDGLQNDKQFMVMTLTDLKWSIDLYLFGNALPKYHRLSLGTVTAILNPSILPPRRGKEDTGKFSLALNDGDDQILEIGKAKHLGYCSARKKDGSSCSDWVDTSKTTICEWHLNQEIKKTQSGRMGVNGNYGGRRYNGKDATSLNNKNKVSNQGTDYETGSRYFAVSTGRKPQHQNDSSSHGGVNLYTSSHSTARLLDNDSPFAGEKSMLERDKSDRLRKQLAAQEQERQITKTLGKVGGGRNAGSEYMRQRSNDDQPARSYGLEQRQIDAAKAKADILNDGSGSGSKKRAADSVRLSPVKKKTRFVTEKGIREAGRDSLGSTRGDSFPTYKNMTAREGNDNNNDDDDDDDLDIIG